MIVLRFKSFWRWQREWTEGGDVMYVNFEVWITPVKIIPAATFQRLVDWVIKQPCWSSRRWKSLT